MNFLHFFKLVSFSVILFIFVFSSKFVSAENFLSLAENTNLRVQIGDSTVPFPDEEDDDDDEEDESDDEITETFEIGESQYFPELTTEDQIKPLDDSISNLELEKAVNLKDEVISEFKKDLFDADLITSPNKKSKWKYFWWMIVAILVTGIFYAVLKSFGGFSMLGLFFRNLFAGRNKKEKWGIVFNAETGQPISNITIQLIDFNLGTVKEFIETDENGFYQFSLQDGNYKLAIENDNYILKTDILIDNKYGEIYQGNSFQINDGKRSIQSDINLALVQK
ncbi:MAG: carboxypeptidase regulatory-like domain-containing protein [Candidatus Moranbacteria bacterium]|nr:carboxypeptidase regulatory-like domain-containing protein [Candidatus Moranbacteria bacterium]